eukprot:Awhi_evm1s12094
MINFLDETKCHNIAESTFGSFAALYHSSTYDTIVSWLNNNKSNSGSNPPFNDVFRHLAIEGHLVRSSFPPLVLEKMTPQNSNGEDYTKSKFIDESLYS